MGATATVVGGEAEGEFTVTVKRRETVAAALPMQDHWLPLSNLDLLLPAVDVSVFFCYENRDVNVAFGAAVSCLKRALAQALVSYYAFGGEVVRNSIGEPELLCNNRGVDFTVARADVELCHLNLYNPDESVEGKLVPVKKHGVLSVQATVLRCGGLVVACSFDHRIADAYSANMFLLSWAHLARPDSPPPPIVPSFRRSLLCPRRPGRSHPAALDHIYHVPISSLPPPSSSAHHHQISRIYYMEEDRITHLQGLASTGNAKAVKRTKLESFSAFLWKMVAECAAEEEETRGKTCKMGIVVDGRRRLGDGQEAATVISMTAYFGNVISVPYGTEGVEELREAPLSEVAAAVHDFLDGAVTKDHFLGLIDWVEALRPDPAVAEIYASGTEDGPAFVVSSGQRFPVRKMDFGWGRPVFGSYHFPWGGDAGYVMTMPSPTREGDWVVYMHLFKRQLDFLEAHAADVLRPLTADYLHLVGPSVPI